MTDVKKLLAEATPLPWRASAWHIWKPWNPEKADDFSGTAVAHTTGTPDTGNPYDAMERAIADAALIAYAVNHLPDYEAAVDALAELVQWHDREPQDKNADEWKYINYEAKEAVRRLRGDA